MDDLLQEDDCEGLLLVDGTCLSTMYALGVTPLIRCVHHLLKELDEEEEPCSPPNGKPLRPEPEVETESSSQASSQCSLS